MKWLRNLDTGTKILAGVIVVAAAATVVGYFRLKRTLGSEWRDSTTDMMFV